MGEIVLLTDSARRDLARVPRQISLKFSYWIDLVENYGVDYARKIPGFHDEPLKGRRLGQRSIRLSRSYRAIYRIGGKINQVLIVILEVNKHDY